MFSDNLYFSESSEIFRNIFSAIFQKFKFSNFLHSFVFHCVFFRTLELVKVHELGSWSSYSNAGEDQQTHTKSGPRPIRFDTIHSAYNKVDLIQFCSSRVFNIAWYFLLGYSHSSIISNQINIFYGFSKMALF